MDCCCPVALTGQKVSSRNLEPSWGTGAKSGDTRQGWRSSVIEYRSVGWPHGYFLLFSLTLTLQAMQGTNGYELKLVEWKKQGCIKYRKVISRHSCSPSCSSQEKLSQMSVGQDLDFYSSSLIDRTSKGSQESHGNKGVSSQGGK